MNECAHSWQSDLSLPNDNACDLDKGHEKATSGGISFSFLASFHPLLLWAAGLAMFILIFYFMMLFMLLLFMVNC